MDAFSPVQLYYVRTHLQRVGVHVVDIVAEKPSEPLCESPAGVHPQKRSLFVLYARHEYLSDADLGL